MKKGRTFEGFLQNVQNNLLGQAVLGGRQLVAGSARTVFHHQPRAAARTICTKRLQNLRAFFTQLRQKINLANQIINFVFVVTHRYKLAKETEHPKKQIQQWLVSFFLMFCCCWNIR
eukprot:Lithocolla_globosa_v1_NODE_2645_length_1921_cov_8.660772.p3 type:complete len:117 gc:universal NODE_2645_length_1921_cov_8.660772:1080-730(-)